MVNKFVVSFFFVSGIVVVVMHVKFLTTLPPCRLYQNIMGSLLAQFQNNLSADALSCSYSSKSR